MILSVPSTLFNGVLLSHFNVKDGQLLGVNPLGSILLVAILAPVTIRCLEAIASALAYW